MYTATFFAGETTVSFDVQIIDDDLIENDEILQFMILPDLLPNNVGSGIPNNMATLIIIDDAGIGPFVYLCSILIMLLNIDMQ